MIVLLGDPTITVAVGGIYIDPGATATDNKDGDITDWIVTMNPVDTSVPDTYIIIYNVSDSEGNNVAEVVREVIVHDPSKPIITLIGDQRIIITVGETYSDPGATAIDNVDGDINHLIEINTESK